MADWRGIKPSKNVVDLTRPGFGDEGTPGRYIRELQAEVEAWESPETRQKGREFLYEKADMGRLSMDKKSVTPVLGSPNHRLRTHASVEAGRLRSQRTGRSVDDMAREGFITRDE